MTLGPFPIYLPWPRPVALPAEARPDLSRVLETLYFSDTRLIPNSRLPLVVSRAALALDQDDPASTLQETFARNGWTRSWRNGIYPYCHYHSTAHEVLGIAKGSAEVRFGGEGGRVLPLGVGDVVVIPAGVAHQLVTECERFLVVGAYAGGREWDIVREREGAAEPARARIAVVPLPECDPLTGPSGELTALWSAAAARSP